MGRAKRCLSRSLKWEKARDKEEDNRVVVCMGETIHCIAQFRVPQQESLGSGNKVKILPYTWLRPFTRGHSDSWDPVDLRSQAQSLGAMIFWVYNQCFVI